MDGTPSPNSERNIPTRADAAAFRFKSLLLQARRTLTDLIAGKPKRFSGNDSMVNDGLLGRSRTPLWTETDPREKFLVAGKIQNLRIAVGKIDGIEVPAGEVFSFWTHVGRASRYRGFVAGRELREGCIIPNIGGGLCQLSNALYDAAMQSGFEIVERHAHTQVIPGSLAETGRDATVFWNYVDLRFRSPKPFRIEARVDAAELTVTFRGDRPALQMLHQIARNGSTVEPNSCATCGTLECHRVVMPPKNGGFGRSAFLVDEYAPEFDAYLAQKKGRGDLLCMPLNGKRFKKANYAWRTDGFGEIRQSLFATATRAYRSRRLATQGAARQLNLLRSYEQLAASFARKIPFDALHLTVQQNLLPFLWMSSVLGGRTYDVLMTALPMKILQERLDEARSLHTESTTLGDFRADEKIVAAEMEALSCARQIVTPHTEIASLFPEKSVLLDWKLPKARERMPAANEKPIVVFPASTVGRKGCYELRDALRGLDVKLQTLGPYIEAKDFWDGFDAEPGGDDWLARADLVVLPAFVEHRPRRLLLAAVSGLPVIASAACGVRSVKDVNTVAAGDSETLGRLIREKLKLKQK